MGPTLEKQAGGMPYRSSSRNRATSDCKPCDSLSSLKSLAPRKQTELAEQSGIEEYAMSRLLKKLELHHYITRRKEGTDKIVSLWQREQ